MLDALVDEGSLDWRNALVWEMANLGEADVQYQVKLTVKKLGVTRTLQSSRPLGPRGVRLTAPCSNTNDDENEIKRRSM